MQYLPLPSKKLRLIVHFNCFTRIMNILCVTVHFVMNENPFDLPLSLVRVRPLVLKKVFNFNKEL